jgi:hypothetical protein
MTEETYLDQVNRSLRDTYGTRFTGILERSEIGSGWQVRFNEVADPGLDGVALKINLEVLVAKGLPTMKAIDQEKLNERVAYIGQELDEAIECIRSDIELNDRPYERQKQAVMVFSYQCEIYDQETEKGSELTLHISQAMSVKINLSDGDLVVIMNVYKGKNFDKIKELIFAEFRESFERDEEAYGRRLEDLDNFQI